MRSGNWRSTETWLADTGWMRALALALTRDAAAADDVVQDALVVLERDTRERSRPQIAWLVRSLASRWGRTRARATRREHEVARDEALPATDELVARLEIQRVVAEELAALAEPHRTTLLLRYHEGLDAAHIALVQGVEPAAVRKRIERGLAELRARLDQRFDGRRTEWMSLLAPWIPATKSFATSATAIGIGGVLVKAFVAIAAAALVALTLLFFFAPRGDVHVQDINGRGWKMNADGSREAVVPAAEPAERSSARTALGASTSAPAPVAAARVNASEPVELAIDVLVVDVRDEPVGGALVEVRSTYDAPPDPARKVKPVPRAKTNRLVASARTDRLGHVTFRTTEPRRSLAVSAELESLGTSGLQELSVAPTSQELRTIRLVLRPRTALVVEVVDGARKPLAGAVIHASGNGMMFGSTMPWPVADQATDAMGRATFDIDTTMVGWAIDATHGELRSNRARYRGGPDVRPFVQLVVEPPFHVTGRVVDSAGRTVENADVVLWQKGSSAVDTPLLSARSDGNGEFRFEFLRAGECFVAAASPSEIVHTPAVVSVSTEVPEARVELALGVLGSIGGSVTWDDGRAAQGVSVVASYQRSPLAQQVEMLGKLKREIGRCTVDERGHFHIEGLLPEVPYTLVVRDSDDERRFLVVEDVLPGRDDVSIALSERALRKGFATFRVVDATTRAPLAMNGNLHLVRREDDGWRPVSEFWPDTSLDICGLTPGKTHVVYGASRAWSAAPISFVADDSNGTVVEVPANLPRSLVIVVRDDHGPVEGGVDVALEYAGIGITFTQRESLGDLPMQHLTFAHLPAHEHTGRVEFKGLALARYRVIATLRGAVIARDEITIDASSPREFELRARR